MIGFSIFVNPSLESVITPLEQDNHWISIKDMFQSELFLGGPWPLGGTPTPQKSGPEGT